MTKISFFRFVTGIFIPVSIPIYVTMLTWKATISANSISVRDFAPSSAAIVLILSTLVIFYTFEQIIQDYIYGKE